MALSRRALGASTSDFELGGATYVAPSDPLSTTQLLHCQGKSSAGPQFLRKTQLESGKVRISTNVAISEMI